jgi:D-alanine--poly(phosphoribitol) ligase subunit 1
VVEHGSHADPHPEPRSYRRGQPDGGQRVTAELEEVLVELGLGDVELLPPQRSADLVTAILGVFRAGAVCVPLDVSYPAERLRFMADDTGVRLMIGHAGPLERFGGIRAVGSDGALIYAERATPGTPPTEPGLAYVVYTSGSTGRPKGVPFLHRSLDNLVDWQITASRCGAGERTAQLSPASFDVIFQELFTTLGAGGTLVCATEDERQDPQLLWDLVERERVNRLFLPFVMVRSLALFNAEVTPERHPLRELDVTGEQMQCGEDLRALLAKLPDCRMVNQWGTTETHVATSYTLPGNVTEWPLLAPIGTPITDTEVLVVGRGGEPVAPGATGELWIVGPGVGPGFLNLPERTASDYVPVPGNPGARAYRTGDLGRVGPDGQLECLGRADSQVKIRGFRVELGEIEALLDSEAEVAEAVVVAAGERLHARLVLTRRADPAIVIHRVWALLRERLPEHMIPFSITVVDDLPRTPSGKLDRRRVADTAGVR